jgi:hypothetical protein
MLTYADVCCDATRRCRQRGCCMWQRVSSPFPTLLRWQKRLRASQQLPAGMLHHTHGMLDLLLTCFTCCWHALLAADMLYRKGCSDHRSRPQRARATSACGAERVRGAPFKGTQFTCFTGTKVQILTQLGEQAFWLSTPAVHGVLSCGPRVHKAQGQMGAVRHDLILLYVSS